MAMSSKNIGSWLKSHYDKILAFSVLALLVGSLLYLAVRIGTMSIDKKHFEQEIRSYKPKHPSGQPLDTEVFNGAMARIEKPLQLAQEQWTNVAVFVPERRVWCIDCRKPIEFSMVKCPFCSVLQPDQEKVNLNRDRDGDLLIDTWEVKYGFDPDDPSDADKDKDNDGFTNLEEYMAKTDPSDSASHPSITSKLRLERIDQDPFNLRFKSSITLPDKTLQFGLNLRGNSRTYFAKLGEAIKGEGFKVESYEAKVEERKVAGIPTPQKVDVSVLTLRRGDKLIQLVKNQDVIWDEYTAHLSFTPDNSRFTVKLDSIIDLKNEKFKVISIDMEKKSVLIESVSGGQRTTIEKFPESKPEAVREAVPGTEAGSNVKPAENRGENRL